MRTACRTAPSGGPTPPTPSAPAGTSRGRSRAVAPRRSPARRTSGTSGGTTRAGTAPPAAPRLRAASPVEPDRSTARRTARTAASSPAPPTDWSLRSDTSLDKRSRCRASACSGTASPTAARSGRSNTRAATRRTRSPGDRQRPCARRDRTRRVRRSSGRGGSGCRAGRRSFRTPASAAAPRPAPRRSGWAGPERTPRRGVRPRLPGSTASSPGTCSTGCRRPAGRSRGRRGRRAGPPSAAGSRPCHRTNCEPAAAPRRRSGLAPARGTRVPGRTGPRVSPPVRRRADRRRAAGAHRPTRGGTPARPAGRGAGRRLGRGERRVRCASRPFRGVGPVYERPC